MNRRRLRCIFAVVMMFFLPLFSAEIEFDKVVIWGHKLHSHTHSYIHEAFYRTFKHLGYDTYWFDNRDSVRSFDFSRTLFITEGQVDGDIPLRRDCYYILHNCKEERYRQLQWISLQVYTNDVVTRPGVVEVAPFIYYDVGKRSIYMPWATNLLPHEIDVIKKQVPHVEKKKAVFWVGSKSDGVFGNESELAPFIRACKQNRIQFIHIDPWSRPVSSEEGVKFIQSAFMAPAIVGQWQKEQGYIPCRIFKNISYGQLGITNSKQAYELFERKIVYNSDTRQLFFDAQKRLETLQLDELYELMDFVKTKHTYINRINTLLDFFEQVKRTR